MGDGAASSGAVINDEARYSESYGGSSINGDAAAVYAGQGKIPEVLLHCIRVR
jgi:hypothetical protein